MHFADLPKYSIKLQLLNADREIISAATGFFLREKTGIFLYTCWHVVTGYDFIEPKVIRPPSRKFVRLNIQAVQRVPGLIMTGGLKTLDLPLYNCDGSPAWVQESSSRPHADLLAIGILVPQFMDMVAIKVDLSDCEARQLCIPDAEIESNQVASVGEVVAIGGYPHGYSVLGDSFPVPVFVSRALAATQTQNYTMQLLDGAGSRGMSGSPVYRTYTVGVFPGPLHREAKLYGIYTGFLFPDFNAEAARDKTNDYFAALGTIIHINIARLKLWRGDISTPQL